MLINEIVLLESLKKNDLSNNQMKGTIDNGVFNEKLPNLEILNVNKIFFEGEIPSKLLDRLIVFIER